MTEAMIEYVSREISQKHLSSRYDILQNVKHLTEVFVIIDDQSQSIFCCLSAEAELRQFILGRDSLRILPLNTVYLQLGYMCVSFHYKRVLPALLQLCNMVTLSLNHTSIIGIINLSTTKTHQS